MPMFPTVLHEREKVQQRISSGDIAIGKEVVPSSYHYYSVNSDTHALQTNKVSISGGKIRLLQIREKLLQQHEKLGVMRVNTDEYFAILSEEELKSRLLELSISYRNSDNIRQKLRDACRTKQLMIIPLLPDMAIC